MSVWHVTMTERQAVEGSLALASGFSGRAREHAVEPARYVHLQFEYGPE